MRSRRQSCCDVSARASGWVGECQLRTCSVQLGSQMGEQLPHGQLGWFHCRRWSTSSSSCRRCAKRPDVVGWMRFKLPTAPGAAAARQSRPTPVPEDARTKATDEQLRALRERTDQAPTGPDYLFDGGDVDVIVEILHNVESRAQPVGA